jgi:hypothetical protein
LAAGAGGVGGDVRSLAGRGFSLADSGLYQGVVDEGCQDVVDERCEVEHWDKRADKRADKGEGQVALGSAEGKRGGGVQSLFTQRFLTVCDVFSTILYLFSTDCLSFFRPSVTDFLKFYICSLRIFWASTIRALRPVITLIIRVFRSVSFLRINF